MIPKGSSALSVHFLKEKPYKNRSSKSRVVWQNRQRRIVYGVEVGRDDQTYLHL